MSSATWRAYSASRVRAQVPSEDQRMALEENGVRWQQAPSAQLRVKVKLATLGACLGLAALCWLLGWWLVVAGFLSLGLFMRWPIS